MPKNDDEFDFALWLQECGHGEANRQAGQLLKEVVAACKATGKKGKLVLTIDVAAQAGLAEVRPSCKVTKPHNAVPGSSYFVADDGELVTEDPRQLKLAPKVLDKQPARVITFKNKTDDDNNGGGAS